MKKNPYQLPPFARNNAPLDWETFLNRGRQHRGGMPSQADAAALVRLAAEGDFPLDLTHDGRSVLAAALSNWGRQYVAAQDDEPIGILPQPGGPAAVPWDHVFWPEMIAGILIHRGADPFVEFERFRTGLDVPDIRGHRHAHA